MNLYLILTDGYDKPLSTITLFKEGEVYRGEIEFRGSPAMKGFTEKFIPSDLCIEKCKELEGCFSKCVREFPYKK